MNDHSATATNGPTQPCGPEPLKVVIVGAGIGGLFAAIALRAAGHYVSIYESSRFALETGAAVHLQPNVVGLLYKYGIRPEEFGAVTCESITERLPTGGVKFSADVKGVGKAYPYPWQLVHRIDLHNALKDKAIDETAEGKPVEIHLKSKVASVNVAESTIALHDGQRITGDLILGADGVHSIVRTFVLGREAIAQPSGVSAFRFLIPISDVKADPATAHFIQTTGDLIMISGNERRLVMYPCRSNTELNFVAMHPDNESEVMSEDWNEAGSKSTLLKVFEDYSDDVKALLEKVNPETLKLWKLLDLEALDRWTLGNVALLGDAAHPFLPHQGQGAAQAIEDGAAIAALFPLGITPSEVPDMLNLYVESRYERATLIQSYTRDSGIKVKGSKHGREGAMDPLRFSQYNFDHDSYNHAAGVLKKYRIKNSTYQRMPLSFGPTASPRQTLSGHKRKMDMEATQQTAFMTFKTKKSYLQNFLPEGLRIEAPGGWATATYSVTKLDKVQWLGGRGYTHFGLYIHDVIKVTNPAAEGKASIGDFLAILFENMCDPIITGREELDFPKVFATLDTSQLGKSYSLTAGWEGASFCQLKLSDLVPESDVSTPSRPGIWINSSTQITDGMNLALVNGPNSKSWKAGGSAIEFTDLVGEGLDMTFPTLGNIIEGLRGIEICQVVASGIRAS
ncbi:hypothetical protein BGZ60DRAFT_467666 [Tricladium varicosporioides]|nr:hypothetical protein BGZ60DRAFT_467666 [Hymenoscyphus varicosporioides]